MRAYEAWLHRVRGDFAAAREAGEEVARVAQRHGFVFSVIVGQLHASANEVAVNPTPSTLGGLAAAIATYRGLGANALVPSWLLKQAEGSLAINDLDQACRCVDEALSYTDQLYARAEALRLRAEVQAAVVTGTPISTRSRPTCARL